MVLICLALTILVVFLFYRNKRDNEIIAETLDYYSTLATELSTQLKSHRDLTTFLAHDLKSPLAGIISSAQALELAGSSLPTAYLECLRLMQVSGRANLRLLSNFIELLGSGSEPGKKTIHTFPDNRLDLLRGLVESKLIQDGKLVWNASPWSLKTDIGLKHFSTALAEIVSVICTSKASTGVARVVRIEEFFDSSTNQLRISFQGLDQSVNSSTKSGSIYPYTLALQVIEKLGVKIMTLDSSDQASSVELQIPICDSAEKENSLKETNDGQAQAELLLEFSLKQVKSATLSVGTLSDLKRLKDQNNEYQTEEEEEQTEEAALQSMEDRATS